MAYDNCFAYCCGCCWRAVRVGDAVVVVVVEGLLFETCDGTGERGGVTFPDLGVGAVSNESGCVV